MVPDCDFGSLEMANIRILGNSQGLKFTKKDSGSKIDQNYNFEKALHYS